jgi:hypothetical protein
MSLAATIPTLGVGELGCAGCFSLLEALIAPPESVIVEPIGEPRIPLFTVAVVNEDEVRVGAGIIAAMTMRHRQEIRADWNNSPKMCSVRGGLYRKCMRSK